MPWPSLCHNRPDLDRDPSPVHAGPGLRDLHRFRDAGGFEQRVTAEDLLGLHVRAIGHPVCPDRLPLVRTGRPGGALFTDSTNDRTTVSTSPGCKSTAASWWCTVAG